MIGVVVPIWGGRFYVDPSEVKRAKTGGEILECLKDWRGIMPYSSVRCAALAETLAGKKIIDKILEVCNGRGTDQKKGERKRGKSEKV